MSKIYRKKCDKCGKNYEGAGAKFCSVSCAKEAQKSKFINEEELIASASSSEYKRRYVKLLKQNAFEDRVCNIVKETILTLPPMNKINTPNIILSKDKKINEEACLLLSDLHLGEIVSEEEMGGLAHYDFATFQFRYQHLIKTTIDITKNKMSGYNINKLNILGLGDFVSGTIHDELVETAEGTVIEWCFGGAYIVAQGFRDLAKHFNQIDVDCVVGNHGRLKQKPYFKNRYVNWDYVFYVTLMLMLRDIKNIKFNIPKSFFLTKTINNHNFLIMHGDNVKSWMGIPWYGINRMAANFTELLASKEKFFSYICLGHFHSDATLRKVSGERIINGSFTGGDEFSLGALFAVSSPVQMLFGVHKDNGITWRFPIRLDFANETGTPIYQFDIKDNIAERIASETFK